MQSYQREIEKLEGRHIDVAFVPADPRQGEQYYWGLDWFMKHTDTANVFPMHNGQEHEVYEKADGTAGNGKLPGTHYAYYRKKPDI